MQVESVTNLTFNKKIQIILMTRMRMRMAMMITKPNAKIGHWNYSTQFFFLLRTICNSSKPKKIQDKPLNNMALKVRK